MFCRIFDAIHYGAMVTEADGTITHFNKPYGRFLEMDPQVQIGRNCRDVVKNTRMHIVAETGIPEINYVQMIKNQNMVVQRIPIRKNGKVAAVFGQVMFRDVKDVHKLAHRLSVAESKVKLYEQELIALRSTRYTIHSILGISPQVRRLKKEALKASATAFPVLITGESGTGKELFAQAIHHEGNRKLLPFVRINCAAIPKDLLESELFGYEKGAFTGALAEGKPGKFELGHRGTVFLDEIGDLPLEMQPKLLRVLEDKEFERVGSNRVVRSDFRLIAATNRDLEQMVADGHFRKDLYFRLNVTPLQIPPLRERREDIIHLMDRFLHDMALEAAMGEVGLDDTAKQELTDYHWPGNVREVINVLERVLASLNSDVIRVSDLPFYLRKKSSRQTSQGFSRLKEILAAAEKEAISLALAQTGGNKARCARLLGIHRTHLYKKMEKYNMDL